VDNDNPLPVDDEGSLRQQHIAELIATIKESADKLASDAASRGDLKIISRSLRELRYAFKVFSPYRTRRKVSIFGSARTKPDDPTFITAVEFGKKMADSEWMVVTGAASGIMEAGHIGAGRENSMGLNIMLPFEQSANPIINHDPKLVHMKYFFTRKLMFVKECDAVVCLAGGFGTLDEAMEVLTLLQTGKRDMVPVVLLNAPGDNYWQGLQRFIEEQLLARRLISPEDLSLYKITDNIDDAVSEVLGFFRNYHSMRYVRDRLVLRMQDPLGDALFADIAQEFADILAPGGRFEKGAALEAEFDEPDLVHLPRLYFQFNRRSLGRLRQLIDCLNRGRVTMEAAASPSEAKDEILPQE
jgi:uncharacterized protein (TIGR00730 family)